MGETPTDFSLEMRQNYGISLELCKLLKTWCTDEELNEVCSLLKKLEITTVDEIQNITNSHREKFIEVFTNSAKLYTNDLKIGLAKVTAIFIKIWEHKSTHSWTPPAKRVKIEEEEGAKYPVSLNIPRVQMSEFAIIRSKLGEEYRRQFARMKEECETPEMKYNTGKHDPSEGSSTQRGSDLGTQPSQTSERTKKKRPAKGLEKMLPSIPKNDPRITPLKIASLFSAQSTVLNARFTARFSENDISEFAVKALSNRCRTAKTRTNVLRFVLDYHVFASNRIPPAPTIGPGAVITISCWLEFLAGRGPSVPPMGRYALVVFCEALGISMPLEHPAVIKGAKVPKPSAKHAPPLAVEFLVELETQAIKRENPEGLRIYCSLFLLMTLASLRFADTADVSALWLTDTAVCGVSLNHKDKMGRENSWATPSSGFHSGGGWTRPLMRLWEKLKPRKGKYTWLFPHVTPNWEVDFKRKATFGVVRAAIAKIEVICGFGKSAHLHSARNFFATCASQLLYSRENREKLGRWTAGSAMPDRYDRAECATELRLRSEILARIQNGWKPTKAFEVPTASQQDEPSRPNENDRNSGSESCSETSETSLEENIANLEEFV